MLFAGGCVARTQTGAPADEYTRYELLAPGSASLKICYEVTAKMALDSVTLRYKRNTSPTMKNQGRPRE